MSNIDYIIFAGTWLIGSSIGMIFVLAVVREFSNRYLPEPLETLGGIGQVIICIIALLGMAIAVGSIQC